MITEFVRVALHEFGHAIGLDHPEKFGQTIPALMHSLTSNIDSIQLDDEQGSHSIPFILDGAPTIQGDLAAPLVKVKHAPKDDGDTITVKVSVQHIGNTTIDEPIQILLFRSQDDVLDDTDELITTTELPSLPTRSGEEVPAKLKEKGLPLLAGSFVLVSGDVDDRVEELNESNNIVSHRIIDRGCAKDSFVPEDEPNDVPEINQGGIGKLRPGQCIGIEGSTNSFNADFDEYHFFPVGNQLLERTLTHEPGLDFDILFFDFDDTAAPLLSCETFSTPERCSVRIISNPDGTHRFDAVVIPISGIEAYTPDIFSQKCL